MSCMMTEGPRANRPPHWTFASAFRRSGVSLKEHAILLAAPHPARGGRDPNYGLGGRKPWAARRGASVPQPEDLKPPGEVPEIEFTTADGATRTPDGLRGKGVVLNFWATWCAPCVTEMPALAKLAELVKDATWRCCRSPRTAAGRTRSSGISRNRKSGPAGLLDPRGAAARAMGARGIPTTLLIDTQGRERGRLEGAADWADPAAVAAVKELAK